MSAFKTFNPIAAVADEEAEQAGKIFALKAVPGNFAADLVANWERRGNLSEKQWFWVDKLIAEHEARLADPQMKVYRAKIDMIRDHGSDFAKSLVRQFDKNAGLSPKQWDCVDRMIDEVTAGPSATGAHDGGFGVFRELLDESGLKRPTVVIEGYKFSFAPADGKNAGCLYVKGADTGRYFGKITTNNALHVREKVDAENIKRLSQMSVEDLKALMIEQGQQTGQCCFCAKHLTDDRSVVKGYGPTCASKYSLPWGD